MGHTCSCLFREEIASQNKNYIINACRRARGVELKPDMRI